MVQKLAMTHSKDIKAWARNMVQILKINKVKNKNNMNMHKALALTVAQKQYTTVTQTQCNKECNALT